MAITGEWRTFHATELDTALLRSALIDYGLSAGGTHQILMGLPLGDPQDRQILIGLLAQLMPPSGSGAGHPR